jgi:O-antigen/teichoic acid export membrane protein
MRNLIRNIAKPGDSLFHRAANAGSWAVALRVAVRGVLFLRTIILARLLVPDDFGLMAIAVLAIALVDRLTTTGFDFALIQRRGDIRPYLDTAWTVQVLRGAAISSVVFFAAPWIAQFFGAPEAEAVVRVLSVNVLIQAFQNIGVVYFQRDLRFDLRFIVEMSDAGVNAVVSIAAAFIYRDVWALVIGVLAGGIARVVTSYVVQNYRPHFRLVGEYARGLFRYGKWITTSGFLVYATTNLDDIAVGRMLGVAELGLYRMAYNFSQLVATEFTGMTNAVALPAYASIQDDTARLKRGYLAALHLSAFIALPVAIGTILIAPDLVYGVLGTQWIPIIVPMQLLSIAGLSRGISATIGPFYQGIGRPHVPVYFSSAKLAVMVVLLYPAITRFGIDGAAATVAIGGSVTGVVAVIVALRTVEATPRQARQALLYPLINTIAMTTVILGVAALLPNRPSFVSLVVLIAVGIATYLGAVVVSSRFLGYEAPRSILARVRTAPG